jgi:hypothetical protein
VSATSLRLGSSLLMWEFSESFWSSMFQVLSPTTNGGFFSMLVANWAQLISLHLYPTSAIYFWGVHLKAAMAHKIIVISVCPSILHLKSRTQQHQCKSVQFECRAYISIAFANERDWIQLNLRNILLNIFIDHLQGSVHLSRNA